MKRFTETTKWDDRWFAGLTFRHKLVFLYILDHCDAAGVWEPNFSLAEFKIGIRKINWVEARDALAKNLVTLSNGRWWIPSFVAFQYGEELSAEARVHQSIIAQLKRHGIWENYQTWLANRINSKGQQPGDNTMPIPLAWDKDKEKDKDKDKVMSLFGGVGEPDSYETVYAAYPRKIGKQAAMKAISRAVSRIADRSDLNGLPPREWLRLRVVAYANAVSRWPAGDERFIPHPATWFNRGSYDDDPSTWERNAAQTTGRRASFA